MAKRTRTNGAGQLAPKRDESIDELNVSQLLLDPENPRLAAVEGLRKQEDLVRVLWEQMAVDEIALSIAKNSFFKEEQLFVIPQKASEPHSETKHYIVVEGNRRLAALRILLDDDLRKRLGATDLPELTAEEKAKIRRVPVSVYSNRKDLWRYFGFRHINGPKPWDPYSKAVYIAEVRDKHGIELDEIADSIGDRHSTVRRLYRGLKVLEQAEDAKVWEREDRTRAKLNFSHLYTAAAQPEFQKFLGITDSSSLKQKPVDSRHKTQLQELMLWLYGSKAQKREPLVVTQAPHLNQLRRVIATQKGLDALRAGYPLSRALEISVGDVRRFREALTRAREELQQAKGSVTGGYKGEDDLFETIEAIISYGTSIQDEMMKNRRTARA